MLWSNILLCSVNILWSTIPCYRIWTHRDLPPYLLTESEHAEIFHCYSLQNLNTLRSSTIPPYRIWTNWDLPPFLLTESEQTEIFHHSSLQNLDTLRSSTIPPYIIWTHWDLPPFFLTQSGHTETFTSVQTWSKWPGSEMANAKAVIFVVSKADFLVDVEVWWRLLLYLALFTPLFEPPSRKTN